MADIFDLAQKINAQRQRASQGYSSPLEMLPLQIGQLIATRDKEKRVSLKNDSILLSNLIKNANTPLQMENAEQLVDNLYAETDKYPSTKLYGEIAKSQMTTKRDDHNRFIASAKWFDKQLNADQIEQGLDSTDYGLSQINDKTWDGLAHEKFGKSVSDLSDIENIEMMATISKGGSDKFKSTRGWGEWSTVQQGNDEQFLSMISDEGFNVVANKYNISSHVISKINESFDNDKDRNKALAVILAESGGDNSAVNFNYGDTVKGRSYFEMSSEELQSISLDEINKRREELDGIIGGFDAGKMHNFKYHKGKSSYVTIQSQYEDYRQRLDDTLKAHKSAGKISSEEAMGIVMNEYDETKKIALSQIERNLRQYNADYVRLLKMNVDNIKNMDNFGFLQEAVENGKISETSTETDIQKYIDDEADKVHRLILAEEERQRLWTGIEARAGEKSLRDVWNKSDDSIETNEEKLVRLAKEEQERINLAKKEEKTKEAALWTREQTSSKTSGAPYYRVDSEVKEISDLHQKKLKIPDEIDAKSFKGSKSGQLIFDMRENVNNLIEPYKEELKKTISSSKLKDTVFTSKDKERQKKKKIEVKTKELRAQWLRLQPELEDIKDREMRARSGIKSNPENKYWENQLNKVLKEKRNLEMKRNDINKALAYIEAGVVSRKFEATDEDLFNLIVSGNLNLKDLGIPSDIIKEIKKSLRYYKTYIPHVNKKEINKYNFPTKINLNF